MEVLGEGAVYYQQGTPVGELRVDTRRPGSVEEPWWFSTSWFSGRTMVVLLNQPTAAPPPLTIADKVYQMPLPILLFFFFFTLVTGPRRSLSLRLSDTRVYEPRILARLGTTTHFRILPCNFKTPAS